jgi:5'(3')-deoxyribonucleotidase
MGLGMIYFLDLDGVLANMVDSCLRIFNRTETHDDIKTWNFYKEWGYNDKEFWSVVDSYPNFWLDIEPYPWAEHVYQTVSSMGKTFICSSPNRDPKCWSQKVKWCNKHLGIKSRDIILTNHKYLLAAPDRVLIDDSIDNAKSFTEFGGISILFKQPWNENFTEFESFKWK